MAREDICNYVSKLIGIIQLRNGLEQEIFAFGVECPSHIIHDYDDKYLQMDLAMINQSISMDLCPIKIQGILDLQREHQNIHFNGNDNGNGTANGANGGNNGSSSNQGGINRKLRRKRKGSLAEDIAVTSNSSSTSLSPLNNIEKITPFPIDVRIMTSAFDQEYQTFIEDPFSDAEDIKMMRHPSDLSLLSAPCSKLNDNDIVNDNNAGDNDCRKNDNGDSDAIASFGDRLDLKSLEAFYKEQCQEYEALLLYYRVLSQSDDIIVKKLLAIEEYDDRMKKLGARIKQNLSPEDFIRTLASINK